MSTLVENDLRVSLSWNDTSTYGVTEYWNMAVDAETGHLSISKPGVVLVAHLPSVAVAHKMGELFRRASELMEQVQEEHFDLGERWDPYAEGD